LVPARPGSGAFGEPRGWLIATYRDGFMDAPPPGEPRLLGAPNTTDFATGADGELQQLVDSPLWPCKGGDLARSGGTTLIGTRDLTKPAWVFFNAATTYPTPVVDACGNAILAPNSGALICVAPNGEQKWRYLTRTGMSPGPALYGGTLYAADVLGNVYALNAATGEEVWVVSSSEGNHGDSWALTAGHGLVVVCHTGGRPCTGREGVHVPEHVHGPTELIALHAGSGEEAWRAEVPAPLYNVMPAFAEGGTCLLVADSNSGVHKLDVKTGAVLWSSAVPVYSFVGSTRKRERFDMRTWFGVGDSEAGGAIADKHLPRSMAAIAAVWCGGDGRSGELLFSPGNDTLTSGFVRALRVSDGTEVWRHAFDQQMGNGLAVSTIHGVPTVICPVGNSAPWGTFNKLIPIDEYTGALHALHAQTGEPLWRFEADPLHRHGRHPNAGPLPVRSL
jgi:outer membrane protein assembly factor BamB